MNIEQNGNKRGTNHERGTKREQTMNKDFC